MSIGKSGIDQPVVLQMVVAIGSAPDTCNHHGRADYGENDTAGIADHTSGLRVVQEAADEEGLRNLAEAPANVNGK